MSTLSLLESEDGGALAAQVRAVARDWTPGASAPDAWTRIGVRLGVAGLLVPESYGGAGAGLREAAAVAQALGRDLVTVPFLTSAVTATTVLTGIAGLTGASPAAAETLTELAAGTAVAAVVLPATSAQGDDPAVRVDEPVPGAGDRLVLHGRVAGVLGAVEVDRLLVPVTDAHGGYGVALVTAAAGDPGVTVTPETSLDETRPVSVVVLDGAPALMLATGAPAREAVRRALRAATVAIAAEQVGAMEWAVEASTAHLGVRRQFGRELGSYQSLRHLVARMWIDLQQARAVTLYAAAALDPPAGEVPQDEVDLAVSLASVHARSRALACLEDTLQVHGGIGFTWEHPLHRYLKRSFSLTAVHGTPDHHRDAVARLADLPAAGAGRG
ncbi:acyl-CoA dehydrogenase family protein [Nocardioides sp. dk884]|uniref:acyl-CoA dehydrogenase family protein n=2 Tax=unclassified Nocardioides TaxID=2615069 RepID=UPI001E563D12|nr:acyl-CoA dehydrogenase family protein [Nocardioides sp. dk884]